MTVLEQVEAAIAKVRAELLRAREVIDGRWFADQEQQRLAALRPAIDAWAARGREAVGAGRVPSGNGWPGWQEAGNIHLRAIGDVLAEPSGTLEAIKETIADVPETAVEVTKTVGRAARTVVVETAKVAAEAERQILAPLLPVLLVAAVVGVAVIVWKVRKG